MAWSHKNSPILLSTSESENEEESLNIDETILTSESEDEIIRNKNKHRRNRVIDSETEQVSSPYTRGSNKNSCIRRTIEKQNDSEDNNVDNSSDDSEAEEQVLSPHTKRSASDRNLRIRRTVKKQSELDSQDNADNSVTSESEDEVILSNKNKHRRNRVIDSEAEEQEIERAVFSPHTRRSNGYFDIRRTIEKENDSEDNSDDYSDAEEEEEEEEESEKEVLSSHTRGSNENSCIRTIEKENDSEDNSDNSIDDSDAEENKIEKEVLSSHARGSKENSSTRKTIKKQSELNSKDNANNDSKDDEFKKYDFKNIDEKLVESPKIGDKKLHNSTINTNTPITFQSFQKKFNQNKQSDSINFDLSPKKMYSSTMYENEIQNVLDKKSEEYITCSDSSTALDSSSDVIEFNNSPNPSNKELKSPNDSDVIELVDSIQNLSTKEKIIQPKITNYKNESNKTNICISNQLTKVSEEYYYKEVKKLEDLKNNLIVCKNLISSVGSNLPDKGQRMRDKIKKLTEEIKKQEDYISTIAVEDKKPIKNFDLMNVWDQLSNDAAKLQPKLGGAKSLATFNTEKALTVECLKDIHGSIETCPSEDVLADEPKGLKTSLMNHQRHALAWMKWREKQKPRGGILADDMGLGKTLSMISLILSSKECNSEKNEGNSEDEDEEWNLKAYKNSYNGGTIVICPASLIHQWENEVKTRVKRHILNVYVHHGCNRESRARRLCKYDIVITTYNIVTREANNLLRDIKWERIILDEAHIIRNHKTLTSIAVCELRAKTRWALTGTPVQNREADLYAIIKFLRCTPFDELTHWKKWIDNKSAGGQQRLNALIKSLMLRRTKTQLKECGFLKDLPTKTIELIEITLDKDEMNVYQKILIYSQSLFAQFLIQKQEKYLCDPLTATKKLSKLEYEHYMKLYKKLSPFLKDHNKTEVKSFEILVLLLRLRQICCHPGLIDSMLDEENISTICGESDKSGPEIDLFEQFKKLDINESKENVDQLLPKAIPNLLSKSNPVFNFDRPSSKFKKVMEMVNEKLKNNNDKAIMVSQWTSVLNLIKKHLTKEHIEVVTLDGTVPVTKRNDIVKEFNDMKNNKRIMLLSLTAGGVGLNLVAANHLFLLDLHWNPQLEAQASDRIYRVGQTKPVFIYKFFCKDTVEERVKHLQDYKMNVANEVLTGAKNNGGSKLTMDDLKNLFGL